MNKKSLDENEIDIEEEIRPKEHQKANFAHLDSDIKNYILPFYDKFITVDCPACDSSNFKKIYEKNEFNFCLCECCKTVFVNPRPTKNILNEFYDRSKFFNGFMDPLVKNEKGRIKHIFEPRAQFILTFLEEMGYTEGDLLDVGCSIGTMLSVLKRTSKFNIYGLDPSKTAIEHCRKRGFDVFPTTIEDFDNTKKKFNVIMSFETIEHLFKPEEFIIKIFDAMKPGGCLIVSTPNYHGFDIAVLGKFYKRVMAPFHLNYFNLESIEVFLQRSGFDVVKKITPGILDVTNVKKQIEEGIAPEIDKFIRYLLFNTKAETLNNFQTFLSQNCLSSHMMVFAIKK